MLEATRLASLEHERAAFAWTSASRAKEANPGQYAEYVNLAKAAPSLIMGNGLMQTLAFFQAKGKEHHRQLSSHLFEWLHRRFPSQFGTGAGISFERIMKGLYGAPSSVYMQATQETLELLRWVRQFADALKK